MAGRVNTRFVIILAVVLTALVGAAAAAVLFFGQRDPAKHLAQARTLEAQAERLMAENADAPTTEGEGELSPAQQKLRDAAQQYRRAFQFTKPEQREMKLRILRKLAEVYRRYRVEDVGEVREWLAGIEQVWNRLLKIDSADREARKALLEISHKRAEMAGDRIQVWNQLYNQADEALALVAEEEEALVRRYRGLAQVIRLRRLNLNEQDAFDQADEDLRLARQAFPDDAEVAFAQARLKLIKADRASAMDPDQAAELREQSLTLMDQFVENHPDNLRGRLGRYKLLIQRYARSRDETWRDKAMTVLSELEKRCLEDPAKPDVARQVAQQLQRLDTSVGQVDGRQTRMGLHRAEQLLRAVVAEHPDDAMSLMMLGRVLREQGRVEDAIRFYELAQAPGKLPVEVRSLVTGQLRLNATRRLVELHITLSEQRTGEAADAAMDKARRYTAALRDDAGPDAPLTLLAEGQLALAQGENRLAVKKLEQAASMLDQPDAGLLRSLSTALSRLGQHGAAAERLSELLETREGGRQPAAYLQLASLRLQAGEPEQAMPLIERILQAAPGHPDALALKAQAMMRSADSREALDQARRDAVAMIEPHVKESDSRRLTLQHARLLRQVGRADEAVAMLESFYEKHPGDRSVLQTLVGLDLAADQRDRARQRIEQAIEANPDDQALQALRMSVQEELTPEQRMQRAEALLQQEEDPVQRHFSLYQLYSRTDQPEKAEQALAAIEQIDPDNLQLREIRLRQALQDERWQDAEAIVQWAKSANDGAGADYAGGAFWEGRLLLARDQAEAAVRVLRRGVEQMPSDSTGRLLLGVALRQAGDLAEAQRTIETALELQPTNDDAWRQLHLVQHARGNHDAALESLRRAIRHGGRNNPQLLSRFIDYTGAYGDRSVAIQAREQLAEQNPDNHENRRKLARLYYQAGRVDDATAVMDKLIADPPRDLQNVSTKAYLLVAQGRVDEARSLFQRFIHASDASAENPANWIAFARALSAGGEAGLADSTFRRAIELDDSNQLAARREYADWLMSRRQFADAAKQYQQVLAADRLNEEARDKTRRRYAEAALRSGEIDKAQEQVDQLLSEHGETGELLLLRAMIAQARLEQGGLSEAQREQARAAAERAIEQAVRKMPNSAVAHLTWARMYFDSDDPETRRRVREHLERVIELGQRQSVARRLLVQWHQRTGDLDAAIAVQEALVAAAPRDPEPRVQLAGLYLADGGRSAQLRQLIDESERLIPDQAVWPQLRARMYQARGEMENALQAMRTAYQRDPSPGRTIELLDLMLRAGADQAALQLLGDRPELVRQSPVIQAMRGRAMCRLDQKPTGKNALRDAVSEALSDSGTLSRVLSQVIPALPPEEVVALLEPIAAREGSGQVAMTMLSALFRAGEHDQLLDKAEQIGDLREAGGVAMETQRQRLIALAAAESGQYNRAAAAYRTLLEMNPDDMLALNNLAFMLADNMDAPDRALPYAERAAELVSANDAARANVLDTLGWVQFHAGQPRQAVETLRQSIAAQPLVDNHLHLAEVYRAMDRPASARREVNAARTLAENSNDPVVRERVEKLARMLDATAADPNEATP